MEIVKQISSRKGKKWSNKLSLKAESSNHKDNKKVLEHSYWPSHLDSQHWLSYPQYTRHFSNSASPTPKITCLSLTDWDPSPPSTTSSASSQTRTEASRRKRTPRDALWSSKSSTPWLFSSAIQPAGPSRPRAGCSGPRRRNSYSSPRMHGCLVPWLVTSCKWSMLRKWV